MRPGRSAPSTPVGYARRNGSQNVEMVCTTSAAYSTELTHPQSCHVFPALLLAKECGFRHEGVPYRFTKPKVFMRVFAGGAVDFLLSSSWKCSAPCSGCSQGLEAPPLALGGEATGVTARHPGGTVWAVCGTSIGSHLQRAGAGASISCS